MKNNALNLKYSILVYLLLAFHFNSHSQESSKVPYIGIFVGAMNYQGDLNPTSFKFSHSKLTGAVTFRKPINRWFSLKAGASIGKIEAADRYNRDYLKPRNLSVYTTVKEAYLGLEVNLLDMSTKRFSPYMYGSVSLYHFNPWAYDNNGKKVYLQPLSTEGQGISQYPKQRPYKLTQTALGFGVGARYALSEYVNIGVEFSQRKTFTDYLDDVSSIYVDKDVLLQAKGAKAVEMAYRGDELPGGQPYPAHGEQRGTPSEMDWYYFYGFTLEIKLPVIGKIFKGLNNDNSLALHSARCPKYF